MKNRKIRLLTEEKERLRNELDELITRLYGSSETYEKAKESRFISTDREVKVAAECAEKGIAREAKQYPSRFKSTRR